MTLNLHFLEIFTKIVEFGSFSKTALNLNLSQSAISQQIEVLEKYFGAKLFERSIKGVQLTDEGKILKKYCDNILDNVKMAKMEIARSLGEIKGILRISSSTIPGEHILPKYIIQFKKKYPNIEFEIEVNDSEISLNRLREGIVDLAAVGSLDESEKFDFKTLAEEELVLVVPKDHELVKKGLDNLKDISKYSYIFREKTSGTRKESEKILKTAGIKIGDLEIVGELNTTESILTAISEGLGISLVSSIAASKLEKTGLVKCLKLLNISTARKLYLVKKKQEDRTESQLTKAFWNFVKKETI
ncbi:MAG: LysR family transcriptional regulator [Candidatus Helarchaeota archaeon]|nr:LysR family transcriptional regulator [Candidatus Helarchaeota archaeon]